MATVWELITSSSTLPATNDFWDHLNNLGSGGGTRFVLVDTVEVELVSEEIDVEIVEETIELELVDDTTEIEIIDVPIDVEIS